MDVVYGMEGWYGCGVWYGSSLSCEFVRVRMELCSVLFCC